MKKVTIKELRANSIVKLYIHRADMQLKALGYTEHGGRHVSWVSRNAGKILRELNYPERLAELAEIAGYLHDVGNMVNREHHAQTGAILAKGILDKFGMDEKELTEIMLAIGNHHEEDGYPSSPVTAALILADKADVRRTRVRTGGNIREDIHDRVNFAATRSNILVSNGARRIVFKIQIDTKISPVMEYFQIFLSRMLIASKASLTLGCKFELYINDTKMV